MKNLTFISGALLFSFISCQRDEEIINNTLLPPPPVPANTIDDFTKFNAGNYWLYQHYTIDSTSETADAGYDSCYYAGDTICGSCGSFLYKRVYFYSPLPLPTITFLKDSLGYLISCGIPILTTEIENDTFYVNSDSTLYYMVSTLSYPVTVPAGTFTNVLDVTCHIYYQHALDGTRLAIAHAYYAKDIGKILEQFYYSGELYNHPEIIHERRLIGYLVN